jgi:carboxylesterase
MAYPVLSGTEPFAFPGGDVGVLLLHGFTGSPQGLRPWGEALRDGGHRVLCPLLPGHGTHWKDLAGARAGEWIQTSEAALNDLAGRCRTVVICSLSFGSALALHLAATRPEQVAGVVTVNASLYHKDRRLVLLPLMKFLVATAPGVGSDLADSAEKELAYERVPLKTFASALAFQRQVRAELPRVRQPLLCYVSRQDHVVDPGCTTYLADHVASSDVQVSWLERSYHVATLDYDRQVIFDGSLAFIRRIASVG